MPPVLESELVDKWCRLCWTWQSVAVLTTWGCSTVDALGALRRPKCCSAVKFWGKYCADKKTRRRYLRKRGLMCLYRLGKCPECDWDTSGELECEGKAGNLQTCGDVTWIWTWMNVNNHSVTETLWLLTEVRANLHGQDDKDERAKNNTQLWINYSGSPMIRSRHLNAVANERWFYSFSFERHILKLNRAP